MNKYLKQRLWQIRYGERDRIEKSIASKIMEFIFWGLKTATYFSVLYLIALSVVHNQVWGNYCFWKTW